jgi:hypothetical protein
MTETYPISASTTFSDGADTVVTAQTAFRVEFSVSGAGTRPSVAAVPEMLEQITVNVYPPGVRAIGEEAWQATLSGVRSVGIVQREPTDEELLEGGRTFMAELEHEFGRIPDDVRAEIRRKWHG